MSEHIILFLVSLLANFYRLLQVARVYCNYLR